MRFTKHLRKYLAHSSTILFIAGFCFDAFFLPDIADVLARYIGCIYLAVIALLIYAREWLVSRNTASEFEQKLFSVFTFGISYFSGSALSFVFIYAFRSGAFSVSWPLFLVLALCIIANELVSTHNFRFTLDVGILFVATLFYAIFTTPFLLHVQNDTTFLVSIGITLCLALLYIRLLQSTSDTAEYEAPRGYALAVGIPMFVSMLYFLNAIPAIPLSLQDAGIYHSVIRKENGAFEGLQEVSAKRFAQFRTQTFNLTPQDTGIYFYSAINAPATLTAPVSHVWEYFDQTKNRWVVATTISFDVAGGREDGYRAYSHKENITEGLWRVTVKVDTQRIVGRVTFKVKKVPDTVGLKPVTL